MYGIRSPDGGAHFDEFCVSGTEGDLIDEAELLNEEIPDGDPVYEVVGLFAADQLQTVGWLRQDFPDDIRNDDAPLFMLGGKDPSGIMGVKYVPLVIAPSKALNPAR